MANVTQLGYLGIGVSDLPKWEQFANNVIGLQSNGRGADGSLYLKMDENHHRFIVHPGGRDDLAYTGWEVKDEAALADAAERLNAMGYPTTAGTADEARDRGVIGLIKLKDPSGIATEVYYGPLVEWEKPFHSPRAIGGFEAGNMGMGHIVVAVDNEAESIRFYREGLGLKISDYIEWDLFPGHKVKASFFHCNPRHHSIAIMEFPGAPQRLHHFMVQLKNVDDVGHTYYLCQDENVPIASSLGRHTNDHMVSFYLQTPSGFQVEYGFGARVVDDAVWEVQLHHAPSTWGHRPMQAPQMEQPVAATTA